MGVTSLVKSNTGSLALLTSNSFAGGVFINDSGSVIITNDSALGAGSGAVTLNGGTLQINGGVTNSRAFSMPAASYVGVGSGLTARFNGAISGAGDLSKIGTGTLTLAGNNTYSANTFVKAGTLVLDSGGVIRTPAANWVSIGQNGSDNGTLTLQGTAAFYDANDFNVGDLDASVGTLNIGGSATLGANQFYVGSANDSGATAVGTVNQTGGSVTQTNTGVGFFCLGGRNSATAGGVGTYNISGGTLTAGAGIRVGSYGTGTLNQSGGTIYARGGINIARHGGFLRHQ